MDKELRILILEDNPLDTELVEFELRKAGLVFTPKIVDTKEDFLKALDESVPDIILSDYDLPTFDGLEALEIAKGKCPDVPFILVTGRVGEEFAIETLKKGVTDYVMKANLKRLIPAINRALEEAKLRAERKKAEAELWESQERYRALVDNTVLGIAVMDTNYRIIMVNTTFAKLFKKSAGDFVGKYCFREFEKRDAVCTHCPGTLSMVSSKTEDVEVKVVLDDGRIVYAHNRAAPFFGLDGMLKGFIEMVEDITERKQAEEALRESEERYRMLFNEAMYGIAVADADTGIMLECNQALADLVGRNKAELIGRHQAILHPYFDDIAGFSKTFKEHLMDKEGQVLETQVITSTGEIREVEIKANLLYLNGRKMLQGIFRDITDRKKTEEAIRTSEAQLSNALRIAHAGHWEYDVASDTFTFNDNFYRIFRTSADEVGGYKMSSAEYARRFCHPEDMHLVRMETQAAIETEYPEYSRELEHRILYSNGDVGYIAVRFFIVKDSQGRTVKTYGVNQDITERKKAEEKLKEQAEVLQEQADQLRSLAARLTLIEEKGLRQIANELHDSVGQKLALSKIRLEELRSLASSDNLSEPFDELHELISNIISQIRSLTFELSHPVLYEIGFEAAVKWLGENYLKQNNISFEMMDDGRPKPLSEDTKVLLFRSTRELMVNVVEHARARKVTASIQREGGNLHLVIEDDGDGFDTSSLADRTMETASFGLFSIRERLRLIGGKLDIESEHGKGTKAAIWVPLKSGEEHEHKNNPCR